MSEAKHTPGPWLAVKYTQMKFGLGNPGDSAWMMLTPVYTTTADDEMRANARLIATAPEMLDKLKAATDALAGGLWDYGPGQDEHEKCNEVIEACRAVIAKATGGAA